MQKVSTNVKNKALRMNLEKDPSTGLKSSEAVDRWASEIGWKIDEEAATETAKAAQISARNPARLVDIVSVCVCVSVQFEERPNWLEQWESVCSY